MRKSEQFLVLCCIFDKFYLANTQTRIFMIKRLYSQKVYSDKSTAFTYRVEASFFGFRCLLIAIPPGEKVSIVSSNQNKNMLKLIQ
jgi:hypothetical protein